MSTPRHTCSGFTLTELIIAMILVGAIAVFAVTKVVGGTDERQKKAAFKEVLSTINSGLIQAKNLDDPTTNDYDYFKAMLNPELACPTDANAEGCFPQTGPRNTEPGFRLHNGVTIAGFNKQFDEQEDNITIDWNGAHGPNTLGEDQLIVVLTFENIGDHPQATCNVLRPHAVIPGECLPALGLQNPAANNSLFTRIYQ